MLFAVGLAEQVRMQLLAEFSFDEEATVFVFAWAEAKLGPELELPLH